MFDRGRRLVRSGNVACGNFGSPYELVEFKTASDAVPRPYRDVWTLGVGIVDGRRAWYPAKPIRREWKNNAADDGGANDVRIEPVEWDDLKPAFERGTGRLFDVEALDVRPAEVSTP